MPKKVGRLAIAVVCLSLVFSCTRPIVTTARAESQTAPDCEKWTSDLLDLKPSDKALPSAGDFGGDDQKLIQMHCPAGMPEPDKDVGKTVFVTRHGYVLLHSSDHKVPLWVCERVHPCNLDGPHTKRQSHWFKPDPKLEGLPRSEKSDYLNSGYDRGHMAPLADQTTNLDLKIETFFLSNMAPRCPALNQQMWKGVETKIRSWVDECEAVYTITGPIFGDTPGTACNTPTSKPGSVSVPTHFYKIVAAKDTDGGWHSIGIILENRKYPFPYPYKDHIVAIDKIEELAGINFMPGLSSEDEERLERNPSNWDGWPEECRRREPIASDEAEPDRTERREDVCAHKESESSSLWNALLFVASAVFGGLAGAFLNHWSSRSTLNKTLASERDREERRIYFERKKEEQRMAFERKREKREKQHGVYSKMVSACYRLFGAIKDIEFLRHADEELTGMSEEEINKEYKKNVESTFELLNELFDIQGYLILYGDEEVVREYDKTRKALGRVRHELREQPFVSKEKWNALSAILFQFVNLLRSKLGFEPLGDLSDLG